MIIAVFDTKPWERSIITKELKGQTLNFFAEPIQKVPLAKYKKANIISGFITSNINKHLIENIPDLKLIATRSTGFDHIDLKTAAKHRIKVANVPSYGENTVAEHAFALILDLSRNIHSAYLRTKKNDFSIKGLMGFDLAGKTIGVIGCGHIGKHVVRIARGFGMKVLVFDKHTKTPYSTSLKNLLQHSDVITLHLPGCKETNNTINKKNIGYIKKGALLINTARGSLVKTDVLIEALNKGILRGVGIDVIEDEDLLREEHHLITRQRKGKAISQLVNEHKLLLRPNVIYTPHIAFYSQEAVDRITRTTIANIKSFLKGKLQNEVKR